MAPVVQFVGERPLVVAPRALAEAQLRYPAGLSSSGDLGAR